MAAIGFIYAWQKLYPVLIFRSVVAALTCIFVSSHMFHPTIFCQSKSHMFYIEM